MIHQKVNCILYIYMSFISMKINTKTIFKHFLQQPNLYMVSEQHYNEIMAEPEPEPNTLAMPVSFPLSIINPFENTLLNLH